MSVFCYLFEQMKPVRSVVFKRTEQFLLIYITVNFTNGKTRLRADTLLICLGFLLIHIIKKLDLGEFLSNSSTANIQNYNNKII